LPTFPAAQPIGALGTLIAKLRSSFPASLTATTLQQLGIAPKNERYLLNVIRFLGFIDESGGKKEPAVQAFFAGTDAEFQRLFGETLLSSYAGLFELHAADTWSLSKGELVTFFRGVDRSSDLVGSRQADTFIRLAEIAGKREAASSTDQRPSAARPTKAISTSSTRRPKSSSSGTPQKNLQPPTTPQPAGLSQVALTVRIEINLPTTADQAVHDSIFRSIRENLMP